MTTRWKRFYEKQMEDGKLRAAEKLSQTKLAAKAEMSAPKISAMENEPRNLTIGTLIRVAHALGSSVEIKLVRRKRVKTGRVKARAL